MQIQSWLPIFPGFYGTIFQADETPYIEDGKTSDDYEWDYAGYMERIAKACVGSIETWLNRDCHLKINIGYELISSPKEYNFGNDSINVIYTLSKQTLCAIRKYLVGNNDAFTNYLKERYTSCSGFISSYEPYPEFWLNDLEHSHKFGAVLDFILRNEQTTSDTIEMDLYYSIADETWIDGELEELV